MCVRSPFNSTVIVRPSSVAAEALFLNASTMAASVGMSSAVEAAVMIAKAEFALVMLESSPALMSCCVRWDASVFGFVVIAI